MLETYWKSKLLELGRDRPYHVIYQDNTRLVVQFLGDYTPTILKKGDSGESQPCKSLGEMTLVELRKTASALGIPTRGRIKAELVRAIQAVRAESQGDGQVQP